jgi:hypothetical protein
MTKGISFSRPGRAILILLKSKDKKDNEYSPIPGNTHLDKELFAICQMDLGKNLIPELKFEPDNYGPYDETVFAALGSLEDGRFVSVEPRGRGNIIKLTDVGKAAADDLWAELETRER